MQVANTPRLEDFFGKEVEVVQGREGENDIGVVVQCGSDSTIGTLENVSYDPRTGGLRTITVKTSEGYKELDVSDIKPLIGPAVYNTVAIYHNHQEVLSFIR